MSNTIEAAEELEKEIAKLEHILEQQQKIVAVMENEGIEDASKMYTNITLLQAIIEKNKETAKLIRETAE